MNHPFRSTAYLVAHAYTDPNARMLPQVHAVRIYSEGATSLSYVGRDSAALDIYHASSKSYQEASDQLCFYVQTMSQFAWCRPLMDPRHMEPIDYLHIEMLRDDVEAMSIVMEVLRRSFHSPSAQDLDKLLNNQAGQFVRGGTIDEINTALRGYSKAYARVWLKRDYDAKLEAVKDTAAHL